MATYCSSTPTGNDFGATSSTNYCKKGACSTYWSWRAMQRSHVRQCFDRRGLRAYEHASVRRYVPPQSNSEFTNHALYAERLSVQPPLRRQLFDDLKQL